MDHRKTPAIISRDEAWKQGMKRYYTGTPCGKGHAAERYTSNGGCVSCQLRTARPGPPIGAVNVRVLPPVVFGENGVPLPTEGELLQVGERVQLLVDGILADVRADQAPRVVPAGTDARGAPLGYRMTAKGAAGYNIFRSAGWTDNALLADGYMERAP